VRTLGAAAHFGLQRQPQERVIGGLLLTRLVEDGGQRRPQRGQSQRFQGEKEVVA
jgi:hypothetical protein